MSMIILSLEEINNYREQLSNFPQLLKALDEIEDCEGDLEDAAISLAIHVGQLPESSEDWLDGLAKRCRVPLCEKAYRSDLEDEQIRGMAEYLIQQKVCPEILILPVIIYALKSNINKFCEPLEYKL